MNRILYFILSLFIGLSASAQVSITTESASGCDGNSYWFKASGSYDLFVWSDSNNLDTIVGDSVNFSANTGNYTITVLGFSIFPSDTDTVSFNFDVNPIPDFTIFNSALTTASWICLGDSAQLTASIGGYSSYHWSPANLTVDSTASSTMVFPSNNRIFTLTVVDSNGCVGSEATGVNVQTVDPTIIVNPDDAVICPGNSVELKASSNFAQTGFEWTADPTLSGTTTATVTASPTTTSTYTVVGNYRGCLDTTTVEVEVLPAPDMIVTDNLNGQSICLDEVAEVTTDCPDCIYYLYQFPNSNLQTTSNSQTISPNTAGAVSINIKGVGANGCYDEEVLTIDVDSCFVGTPFSIEELTDEDITVIQRASQLELTAPLEMNQVLVYSILGEEVAKSPVVLSKTHSVSTADLAAGLYVVMIETSTKKLTKKVYLQ